MFWKLSLPIEPLIFIFYFTVEGYNLYITIELFPHIDVMMAGSTMNSLDRDMQQSWDELLGVLVCLGKGNL